MKTWIKATCKRAHCDIFLGGGWCDLNSFPESQKLQGPRKKSKVFEKMSTDDSENDLLTVASIPTAESSLGLSLIVGTCTTENRAL